MPFGLARVRFCPSASLGVSVFGQGRAAPPNVSPAGWKAPGCSSRNSNASAPASSLRIARPDPGSVMRRRPPSLAPRRFSAPRHRAPAGPGRPSCAARGRPDPVEKRKPAAGPAELRLPARAKGAGKRRGQEAAGPGRRRRPVLCCRATRRAGPGGAGRRRHIRAHAAVAA